MRPCIRGLKEFKKGCPEKAWNGEMGCPAWREDLIVENGSKKHIGMCVDMWVPFYLRHALRLLDGNQIATEGTRNMMACLSLVSIGKIEKRQELGRIAEKYLIENKNAEN